MTHKWSYHNWKKFMIFVFIVSLLFMFKIKTCVCDEWEYKLFTDLLRNYDNSIRPSLHHNHTLNVTFSLALAQIIDVDERNMVITTNCWLNQGWIDYKLRWDPVDYDGIQFIHIPAEKIWKPDILLVNNADSWAKISSISTNAVLRYDGNVTWLSTVIFKSSCTINVKYFPFDEQICDMIFASWTFDGIMVDININTGDGDTTNYIKNGEWNLVKLLAIKYLRIYSCCEEPFPEIYYKLIIRRRPLYYVFNMVFPCLLITLVAFLGFYLPPDSSEKVSIGITTLLSLTVFLMLVAESMPPTSEQLPLLGIYYAVTISIVSFSTAMAVLTLNINNKGMKGRRVPKIVKILFLNYLARILRTELTSVTRAKKKAMSVRTTSNRFDATAIKNINKNEARNYDDDDNVDTNTNENNYSDNYTSLLNDSNKNISNTNAKSNGTISKSSTCNTIKNSINDDIEKETYENKHFASTSKLKLSKSFSIKNRLDSSDTLTNLSESKLLDNANFYNFGKSDGPVIKASEEDMNINSSYSLSSKLVNESDDNYAFCSNSNDVNNEETKNNEKQQQIVMKSVYFEKKPSRPTSILKNNETPFVSKFNMLTESFNRGSFNSFSVLYPQTPLTPCNLHCICDCSSSSICTNENNHSAQSFLNSNQVFSKKKSSNTTPVHNLDSISRYDNEESDNNISSNSPLHKLQKCKSYNNDLSLNGRNNYNSDSLTALKHSNSNNQVSGSYMTGFDQDFLTKLEAILEKQFSPLVKILMKTLEQNQSRQIEDEKFQMIQDEWGDVALVSDHFLCYFFPFLTFFTCFMIFIHSPHVFASWW